jgi:cytoskeleton protein RodZ
VFLFAGASWLLMPSTSAEKPAIVADAGPSADPMPTASTDDKAADIAVTDEPMTDIQTQAAGQGSASALPGDAAAPAGDDQTVVDAQPVQPPADGTGTGASAADETAGTNLDGLTQLINENVKVDPTKPTATAKAAKPAKALPAATIASAEDMTLTPGGREFGAKTGGTRVILRAKAPVWVRIEDKAGKVVMTQMLQKGDTYRVPDRDGLVVIARDGSLISYLIDGKEKGVLGSPGEILTGRSLDLKDLSNKG